MTASFVVDIDGDGDGLYEATANSAATLSTQKREWQSTSSDFDVNSANQDYFLV